MFDFLKERKLISVSGVEEKDRIADVFAENGIKFTVRNQNLSRRHFYDEWRMGFLAVTKPEYVYTFFVHKDDVELALRLI